MTWINVGSVQVKMGRGILGQRPKRLGSSLNGIHSACKLACNTHSILLYNISLVETLKCCHGSIKMELLYNISLINSLCIHKVKSIHTLIFRPYEPAYFNLIASIISASSGIPASEKILAIRIYGAAQLVSSCIA